MKTTDVAGAINTAAGKLIGEAFERLVLDAAKDGENSTIALQNFADRVQLVITMKDKADALMAFAGDIAAEEEERTAVPEPDESFRARLLLKMGASVNAEKTRLAHGAALDEIGECYGMTRGKAAA